jgi:hypothetical protein
MCSAILHTDLNARDMYIKYVSLAIYGDIYSITASDVHVPAAWPRRQIHVDRSMKSAKCRMNGKWAPKDSMEFEVPVHCTSTVLYYVVLLRSTSQYKILQLYQSVVSVLVLLLLVPVNQYLYWCSYQSNQTASTRTGTVLYWTISTSTSTGT